MGFCVKFLRAILRGCARLKNMATQTYQWGNTRRSAFRVERWSWSLRLWLLVAFALAILFHWWLYYFFSNLELGKSMLPHTPTKIRPERVTISPEILKDQKAIQNIPDIIAPSEKPPQMKADIQDIVEMLPKDKALDLTPEVKKITNFIAPDQDPRALNPAQAPSLAAIANSLPGPDLASAANALKSSAMSKAVSAQQLVLPARPIDKEMDGVDGKLLDTLNKQSEAGNAAAQRVKGFSNLDDLLSRGSNVNASTAPILLPTDLLFEYGSDQLAENARLSLMKLGLLIMRNPNSRFIIEGHTDSIGSDDYNMELSQRRANAVVGWLIDSLKLTTDRIVAVGLGRSRLIIPDGTKEEQAINRRVEIKVRPLK
ncbi:MAG: hypothetical protein RL693_2267 [Verrucomicrobiota bacterium]